MDVIDNVYVGIFPLFGILIADEVCHIVKVQDGVVGIWSYTYS